MLVRPGDDSAALAAAASEFDDFGTFEDELFGEINPGDVGAQPEFLTAEEESAFVALLARIVGWALVASTIVLVAVVVLRVLWNRMFSHLAPAARRWAKVQLLATVAGFKAADERTATESADDLAARIGEPGALRSLAVAYTRVRYGGPEAGVESEAEAEALDEDYDRVRKILVRRGLRRITRLGRVPDGGLARRDAAAGASR